MAKTDSKYDVIAKRYAEALFLSAKDIDSVDKVYDDLKFVGQTYSESNELSGFLTNKLITHQDKKDVLSALFKDKISEVTFNFLCLLIDNGRFETILAVVSEYKKELNRLNNIVVAEITSAVEIPDELKSRLISTLEAKTAKKIEPNYKIDNSIIAGLIVNIKEKTIDSSLKTKISNIKKQLI